MGAGSTGLFQYPPKRGCTLARMLFPTSNFFRPRDRQAVDLTCCVRLTLASFLDLSRVQLPHDAPHDSVGYSGHFGYFTYGKAVSPQLHDAINRRRFIA